MPTPHKHAKIIKAWADGHKAQILNGSWKDCSIPTWPNNCEYRIKPEPVVIEGFITGKAYRTDEKIFVFSTNPSPTQYDKATLTIHPDE